MGASYSDEGEHDTPDHGGYTTARRISDGARLEEFRIDVARALHMRKDPSAFKAHVDQLFPTLDMVPLNLLHRVSQSMVDRFLVRDLNAMHQMGFLFDQLSKAYGTHVPKSTVQWYVGAIFGILLPIAEAEANRLHLLDPPAKSITDAGRNRARRASEPLSRRTSGAARKERTIDEDTFPMYRGSPPSTPPDDLSSYAASPRCVAKDISGRTSPSSIPSAPLGRPSMPSAPFGRSNIPPAKLDRPSILYAPLGRSSIPSAPLGRSNIPPAQVGGPSIPSAQLGRSSSIPSLSVPTESFPSAAARPRLLHRKSVTMASAPSLPQGKDSARVWRGEGLQDGMIRPLLNDPALSDIEWQARIIACAAEADENRRMTAANMHHGASRSPGSDAGADGDVESEAMLSPVGAVAVPRSAMRILHDEMNATPSSASSDTSEQPCLDALDATKPRDFRKTERWDQFATMDTVFDARNPAPSDRTEISTSNTEETEGTADAIDVELGGEARAVMRHALTTDGQAAFFLVDGRWHPKLLLADEIGLFVRNYSQAAFVLSDNTPEFNFSSMQKAIMRAAEGHKVVEIEIGNPTFQRQSFMLKFNCRAVRDAFCDWLLLRVPVVQE